jgi:alkylation response protein AidB-like acyl-CoA dehydrogenase
MPHASIIGRVFRTDSTAMKPALHAAHGTTVHFPEGRPTADMDKLVAWLQDNAEQLDQERHLASALLPALAQTGLLRVGVPAESGGSGGTVLHAIETIAAVAEHSLTAAFVLWSQRAFIECLLASDNAVLRADLLPALLAGERAGAVGLSNAMKFLAQMDALQVAAEPAGRAYRLTGQVAFVTNLHREGYVAAVAASHGSGRPLAIYAVTHDMQGVVRSDDLDLIALRASNTAELTLDNVPVDSSRCMAVDGPRFLARIRPRFLGLQCALSIGLARRSLRAIDSSGAVTRAALAAEGMTLESELHDMVLDLFDGIECGGFIEKPRALFSLRLLFAKLVDETVSLEMLAAGSRGYLRGGAEVARRRREAAFIPIVTPGVVQIRRLLDT